MSSVEPAKNLRALPRTLDQVSGFFTVRFSSGLDLGAQLGYPFQLSKTWALSGASQNFLVSETFQVFLCHGISICQFFSFEVFSTDDIVSPETGTDVKSQFERSRKTSKECQDAA